MHERREMLFRKLVSKISEKLENAFKFGPIANRRDAVDISVLAILECVYVRVYVRVLSDGWHYARAIPPLTLLFRRQCCVSMSARVRS